MTDSQLAGIARGCGDAKISRARSGEVLADAGLVSRSSGQRSTNLSPCTGEDGASVRRRLVGGPLVEVAPLTSSIISTKRSEGPAVLAKVTRGSDLLDGAPLGSSLPVLVSVGGAGVELDQARVHGLESMCGRADGSFDGHIGMVAGTDWCAGAAGRRPIKLGRTSYGGGRGGTEEMVEPVRPFDHGQGETPGQESGKVAGRAIVLQ